jgi:hypothetical protein
VFHLGIRHNFGLLCKNHESSGRSSLIDGADQFDVILVMLDMIHNITINFDFHGKVRKLVLILIDGEGIG